MATVSLTNGVTVLVDKRDVARVTRHNWYHHLCGASKPARARTKIGGQWVYMHRYILDLWDRDKVVDHINGDPLDNRRTPGFVSHTRTQGTQRSEHRSVVQNAHHGTRALASVFQGRMAGSMAPISTGGPVSAMIMNGTILDSLKLKRMQLGRMT